MSVVPSAFEMFLSAMMVIVSGGGFGSLPLAMPPGEPDPVMSHVAPDDCLVYLSWPGTEEASADSENRTEQLLADPEVRRLITGLEKSLWKALDDGAGQGFRARATVEALPILVRTLATRPAAFFVGRVTFDQRGLGTPVGLVLNIRGQEDDFRQAFESLQKVAKPGEATEDVELNGREWRVWPTPLGAPPVVWSVIDGYFVVAAGPGTPQRIAERLKAESTPEWLTTVQKRLPVERQSMISHINVEGIVDNVSQFLGPITPQVLDTIKRLGLHNVQSLTSVNGLDGGGCVTKTWLQVDGELTGVLAPLAARPLAADDLSPIPADATAALAVRVDPAKVFEQFTVLLGQFDPRAVERLGSDLERFDSEVGFSVRDVLTSVGDVWRLYQSPSEGGSAMTGWTAVANLRNPEKAVEIAEIIAKNAREIEQGLVEQLGRRGVRSLSVAEYEFNGETVYFLNAIGESIPVAPAWCIADDKLVLSMFPQGINAYLRRAGNESLTDNPAVAASLDRDGSPLLLGYYDSKRLLRLGWPLVQMLANVGFAELQQQGINVDISLLPSLSALEQYVGGATMSVVPADDGVEMISRRVLPVGPEIGLAAAAPLFGVAMRRPMNMSGSLMLQSPLDALSPVRSQRTRSTNNLKQIGIALHNHHATFKQFPDEAVRSDSDGPLLSWRVKLLPFLGERELFDRFRMDEPWDSPHNRELINQMPVVYQVPGVDLDANHTCYVGLVGAGTLFDSDRDGMRLRDVTDGTSNTLLLVEASPRSAVIWTKPDDLAFDPEEPQKGFFGARTDGFLGLLGDGSVSFISDQLPDATYLHLSTRNDGMAVNFRTSAQRRPPSPFRAPRSSGTTRRPPVTEESTPEAP